MKTVRLTSLLAVAVCAAGFASVAFVSGCSTPGVAPLQTPAQIAAQVCPPAQSMLTALSALALEPKAVVDLAAARTAVDLACSVGATVNFTNLQTMANSGLQPILAIIKASPITDEQKNALVLDATAANLIINGALTAAANAGVAIPTVLPANTTPAATSQ